MRDYVDDETALQDLMGFLERPPTDAEGERLFGARLRQVLAAIESAAPEREGPAEGSVLAVLSDDLKRRLREADERRTRNPFGEHPEGIGPTLGMDFGRS